VDLRGADLDFVVAMRKYYSVMDSITEEFE
jgi:hypothetical protein